MAKYSTIPSSATAQRLRRRLIAWFRQARRDLPWRRDRDPYHIWVSEIMLQQTQVATVIPYYERFLRRFPTIRALAAATEADVLRQWEGLGYYRRARDLHQAARQIAAEHAGRPPRSADAWSALPGIGRYTVGAILSQAFDERLPIVEANSTRVLCRWFAYTGDPRTASAQRWLWETATRLLPARGAGEFNQALMELGALVCTPAQPKCLLCPVSELCAARGRGLEARIPRKTPAPRTIAVREVAIIVRRGRSVLLVRRPATVSRWANLWEFPHGPVSDGETDAEAARRLLQELTGLRARSFREAGDVRHSITRYVISITCILARLQSGRFSSNFYAEARWVRPEELTNYPLSSPQRKLAALVSSH